jgi:hypothetical protein
MEGEVVRSSNRSKTDLRKISQPKSLKKFDPDSVHSYIDSAILFTYFIERKKLTKTKNVETFSFQIICY